MALTQITFFPVLGLPLIAWLGMITYLGFISTASIPLLTRRGVRIQFKWHMRLAYFSIIMATIHGLLGLATYF